MGYCATAQLSFGYQLGGPEDEWLFEFVDPDKQASFEEDEDAFSPDEYLTETFLKAAGFEDVPWEVLDTWTYEERRERYYTPKKEALAMQPQVSLEQHGHEDFSQWMLTTKHRSVDWGSAQEVGDLTVTEEDQAELQAALEILGIRLKNQTRAKWWLTASFG